MSDNNDKLKLGEDKITVNGKKLGPCCVCKETKQVRDQCFFTKSEEECQEEIKLHNECLKQHGFKPM